MITEIISKLLANVNNGPPGLTSDSSGFSLDFFIDELSTLQSMGAPNLSDHFLSTSSLSVSDAQTAAAQIVFESRILTDKNRTGKVTFGNNPSQKRFVFHFENGFSTGFTKIILPTPLSHPRISDSNRLSRHIKILFVNLASREFPLITTPLGLITLGGYLKRVFKQQVEIKYVDLQLDDFSSVRESVIRFQPDIVGLSVKTGAHQAMYDAIEEIQSLQAYCNPTIVLGNVIPTYASATIHHRQSDPICIVGKGEPAMKALVKHVALDLDRIDLFHIPNSSFVLGSTIYQVGGEPFNLADLGMPDWSCLFNKYPLRNYQEIWIEASRGCPQKKNGLGCSFCAIMPNNDSRDWISRPTEAVGDEIGVLAQLGVTHLRFADEEFMAGNTAQAFKLARHLKQLKADLRLAGLKMPTYDFATRVDDIYKKGRREQRKHWEIGNGELRNNNEIRRHALVMFKETGLTQIYLGLESGSFEHLKRMYKAVTPDDNRRAIEILREIGIQIAGGWIMMDPLMEGIDNLKENIAFLEENRLIPETLSDDFVTNPINRMRVLEGSPFVDIMRTQGLLGAKMSNMVDYDFEYKDPLIADIDEILYRWEKEVGPFMYALKNKVANEVLNRKNAHRLNNLAHYFFLLKRLDFEFLRAIVFSLDNNALAALRLPNMDFVVGSFSEKRTDLISEFTNDLDRGVLEDNAGTLRSGLEQIGFYRYSAGREDLVA